MAYEKQTWVDGVTPVDAEHLNHMEDGIAANAEAVEKLKESDLQTATGNVVSLETMKDVEITLEAEIEGTATLIHQSKNFLPSPMDNVPNKTENGITYTANEDGSVTIVGTLNGTSSYYYMNSNLGTRRTLPPGKYTLSTRAEGTIAPIYISANGIIPGNPDISKGVSIPFEIAEAHNGGLSIQLLNKREYNGKFWMQIERGENATDFEKFKEEKLTVAFPCVVNAYDGTNVFYTENYDTITATAKKDIRAEILNEVNEIVKFDASTYSMPILKLKGNTTEMTKENAVDLEYEFEGRTGTCSCKWQGNSSLTFPKKNYTIKFDTAFEAVEGWGEQKKYCAKANYNDFTQSRNVVSAKIWGEIYEKRTDKNEKLVASPNYGAIDGFPICIVLNDEFHGLYCFNVPKDGWMMGMGDGTNECILCAELHVPATKFESGNAVLDGSDFKLEYITNEDDIAWAVTSVNNLLSACGNSDGTDLDTVGTMLDWNSAIDYYFYSVMLRHSDGLSKNYLLSTYDGTKWFFTAYDMDTVFGNNWNGSGYVSPTLGINFEEAAEENRLFRLIKTYKSAELKARYEYLRKNALSEARIATLFSDFAGAIPLPMLIEESRVWSATPRTSVQTIDSILNWYRLRCQYIDAEVATWD